MQALLDSVPANYAATYLYHMGRGRRVLALAYRWVFTRVCACVLLNIHIHTRTGSFHSIYTSFTNH